jgi:serine/threonine-protein kinase
MRDNGQTSISARRIAPGTRLNGIYEIDRPIASGGMGEIYEGHTVHTGDRVAIKLLRPEFLNNEAALALFRKEASALHNLQHEAIVRYYVCSVDPALQCPYLTMEFVDGVTLSELLTRGPLPFEAVVQLKRRLAAGLHAAHVHGIIHRDVAPDNVLIPGGNVDLAKIIDFGIARMTRAQDGTVIGSGFAGKYNYVSPEQLGLFGGNVTAKSDIYSLGLLLGAAISGRPIDMGGSQAEVLEKRRRMPDLSGIDARFRPLLKTMLQPDPAHRPDSMLAVAEWPLDSGRKAGNSAVGGAAASHPRKTNSLRYGLAGGVLVLLFGIGGLAYFLQVNFFQPKPRTDSAEIPALKTAIPAPSAPANGTPSLTPAAPPAQSAASAPAKPGTNEQSRVDRITSFIKRYDGGDCFLLMPIAVGENAAQIEGYGASVQQFHTLDEAFKRTNGFEADIGLRQVTAKQCPAITFLAQLRAHPQPPSLEISDTTLRSGEVLSGSIEGYGDRHIVLLLISDDGSVHNLSRLAKPSGNGKVFNLRMQLANSTTAQPQLLIAVASSKPLAALERGEGSAEQVFPAALVEAAQGGQSISAAARYFQLQ